MSAKHNGGFRPELETLEDRLVLSTVHPAHPPRPPHNPLPGYIFNPEGSNGTGISVHGLTGFGQTNQPQNGAGFFPTGIDFNHFYPPSIFG
jgi:hypothetical protein